MITCETTETTNLRTAYLIQQYPFELFTQHLPLYPPPITRLSALPEHHWRRANLFVFWHWHWHCIIARHPASRCITSFWEKLPSWAVHIMAPDLVGVWMNEDI
jgi:hypothetical protein